MTERNDTSAVQKRTISVPQAGAEYFGLSRQGSYEAARRGDIPVIRVGRLLRVPVAAMDRKLESAGSPEGDPVIQLSPRTMEKTMQALSEIMDRRGVK
jgi:excisionase family DNA binding protein